MIAYYPPPPSPVLDHARKYVAAGLSVIPVKADGTKAPAHSGWREYTDRRPTDFELRKWFTVPHYGIGVVAGPASGNLAVFDFESAAVWAKWAAKNPGLGLVRLVAASPVVVTPSGGRHVWVRLTRPHPGTVLARDAAGNVLIEIRGEGHQVVAPGSPPACHPLNRPYVFESAGWLKGAAA